MLLLSGWLTCSKWDWTSCSAFLFLVPTCPRRVRYLPEPFFRYYYFLLLAIKSLTSHFIEGKLFGNLGAKKPMWGTKRWCKSSYWARPPQRTTILTFHICWNLRVRSTKTFFCGTTEIHSSTCLWKKYSFSGGWALPAQMPSLCSRAMMMFLWTPIISWITWIAYPGTKPKICLLVTWFIMLDLIGIRNQVLHPGSCLHWRLPALCRRRRIPLLRPPGPETVQCDWPGPSLPHRWCLYWNVPSETRPRSRETQRLQDIWYRREKQE